MASQADVEKALVSLISGTVYPSGVPADPTQSIIGASVRVMRGWPAQEKLDTDLRAGVVNISVFPRPNMERNTTRFPMEWVENVIPVMTYNIVAGNQQIVITGSPPNPYVAQNFAAYVNGVPYVVQAAAGNQPADIAAALCAAIRGGVPGATVSGGIITLPATADLGQVLCGTTGSIVEEVGRQEKQFQIVFWCPNPDIRDAAVAAVDPVLRANYRFALPDGSMASMKYAGSITNDAPQKELLFRCDLFFVVEYPTTITQSAAQLLVTKVIVEDPFGAPILSELDFTDPDNAVFEGVV